jgi:copper chaperone CopZ
MQTQTILITGTNCPACKKLIERIIITISGVTKVDVDYVSGKTNIESNRLINKEEIEKALEGTPYGYKA